MRPVVTYIVIALVAGFVGGNINDAPKMLGKVSHYFSDDREPMDFWSTPAIAGYGKMHYYDATAFKPDGQLSNKVVFQINKSEGEMMAPNLGLERVARVTNLYVAAGVPLDKLKFVVSVNSDAVPAVLNNEQFRKIYGVDNPNLKLIAELRQAGVEISVCDQSVAFHHLQRDWIDKSVVHTLSSGTTVATLQNQGYAFLPL